MKEIIPIEHIERFIYYIRQRKVMMDSDLAGLYGVSTSNLNKAVKRNFDRFPEDFLFQLSKEEFDSLRFQIGISNKKTSHGGRRYAPFVFTEQGVAMLSTVLSSKRAVLVNIQIMRTFVRLRQLLLSNKDLSQRLDRLEKKYDSQFKIIFDAIRQLMLTEAKPKRSIGFYAVERKRNKKSSKRRKDDSA